MKKLLSIVLIISLLCVSSVPIKAINTLVTENSEIGSHNSTESIDIVSKDMSTGEISYSTINYETQTEINSIASTHNNGLYTEKLSAWFPEEMSLSQNYDTTITPRTIWGKDNRLDIPDTTVFPYSTVCYLEIQFPKSDPGNGTAFMISSNIALTAGHNVYNAELGGWVESIKLIPGKNGPGIFNNPYGVVRQSDITIHASSNWVNTGVPTHDWAILVLDENIGEKTGWLGIGWSNSDFIGTRITVCGYPGEYDCYQYFMTGYVTDSVSLRLFYSDIDTSRGQSGGPVYTSDYTVCAIHNYGGDDLNGGSRITQALYNTILSFME